MSVGWWLRWPCAAGSGAWDEPKMASRFCRLIFPCRSLSTNALTAVRSSGLGKSSAMKRKPERREGPSPGPVGSSLGNLLEAAWPGIDEPTPIKDS